MFKRLTAVLTVLCLMLCGCALAQEEKFVSYHSDFSSGTDGWYARSAGGASISVQDGALTIVGRTGSWNSPGRDFPLEAGKEYALSVQVRQDAVASATFMISVAHSSLGVESYENLVTGAAAKGEWVTLSGTWTPAPFDNFILYVETVGNDTLDFSIRDFTVKLYEMKVDEEIPSLKEAFAAYFPVGTAVTQMEARNTRRMDVYASQFAIVTPGNELKPDSVLDIAACKKLAKEDETAVAVHFNAAQPMLSYCRDHQIKVHGHVLVWHSQTPDAFFRESYSTGKPYVSREIMLARLDNYIRLIMEYMQEKYPGVIVSWDVVNEAIDDGTGKLRASNWTKVIGEDFVERAFEIARKYAPADTKLYYNDYNSHLAPKADGIIALLTRLAAEGNIDGYGFQSHYSSGGVMLSRIRNMFEQVEALGLRVRVSELDITIDNTSDPMLKAQAYCYKNLFGLYMEHAAHIDAVQFWGVTDDLSWLAAKHPLIFDARIQPKPAFWAIMELVQ